MSYLDSVNSPQDVKKLTTEELEALAGEIRGAILNRDSKVGGHVGPNLGIVETTIALHYVFDSPRDKIVYDVSHQSYPHKILTGRKEGFTTDEGMSKISGYTNPDESEHDFFKVGHTSTSVSLACGLAKARDLKGEKHNVIAVIGDGSLSGGEALEGLSNAAVLGSNIIVIVNDNEMSIAENHGGLYTNLRLLRETEGRAECNMFKALGFDYRYVGEGNSVSRMIDVLREVKDAAKPTLIHVRTLKGKGYKFAEENKEKWHWNVPFDIASGESKVDMSGENYNDITFDFLNEKSKKTKTSSFSLPEPPELSALLRKEDGCSDKTMSMSASPRNTPSPWLRLWPKAAASRSSAYGVPLSKEPTTNCLRTWQSITIPLSYWCLPERFPVWTSLISGVLTFP